MKKPLRFAMGNVDCANCAAKLENGLRQTPGIEEVRFDFANMILHASAENPQTVIDGVGRLEPNATIRQLQSGHLVPEETTSTVRLSVVLPPLISLALFCLLLLGEDFLHGLGSGLIELPLVLVAYFLAGWNVYADGYRSMRRGLLFDENVLMIIATLGALAIHAYGEAIGVMLFYRVGELLQARVVRRSRRSIRALLEARPTVAHLVSLQGIREVDPLSVAPGETLLVRPGDKIPLDGIVVHGEGLVDTSSLTGESKPRQVSVDDSVLSGYVCLDCALRIRVTRPFSESSMARIMELVENAMARKTKTERFITTFARYYTPSVVAAAAAVALLPPLVSDASFSDWFYRALVLLVISCPCALVISIPLGYFGGLGLASRQGILIKGSSFIDALTKIRLVVFDKTGTLTKGVFKVMDVLPDNGFGAEEILVYGAAAEIHSRHPIARAIRKASAETGKTISMEQVSEYREYPGKGVSCRFDGKRILAGNAQLLQEQAVVLPAAAPANTVVHIAVNNAYAGCLLVGDAVKEDADEAVRRLKAAGVTSVAMLSGDHLKAAVDLGRQLGLDAVHGELLPENKVEVFETMLETLQPDERAVFVGDGINDAPVIARADVGIAMGGFGSDAAVETADVVLMNDSPVKVAEAIAIARLTRGVVWQNIILAFAVKLLFLLGGILGWATMWGAVFADVGTALLAVGNAARIIAHRLPACNLNP